MSWLGTLVKGWWMLMDIKNSAVAGSLESNDIFVKVEPHQDGIALVLESIVYNQFGDEIEKTVREVLNDLNVKNIRIHLNDKGAVDCVIRSRVETALRRAERMVRQ